MTESLERFCPGCGHTSVCSPAAMLDALRQVRMVRRDVQPEPELLGELFRAAAGKFVCPQCGAIGLVVRPLAEENDEDWGMARRCEVCGQPIARERLEALPGTRLCVACQQCDDCATTSETAEYCPKCGTPMVVRLARGAGVTRYVTACPSCRW